MSWRCVVAFLIITSAQAFSPAAIVWKGLPAGKFTIDPTYQALKLRSAAVPGSISSNEVAYFTASRDGTIRWHRADFDRKEQCVEASNKPHGEVFVNVCTSVPAQRWNWLPWVDGKYQIQLRGTDQCLDVVDAPDGFSGASVGLHDCSKKPTEAWSFERLTSKSEQGPSKRSENVQSDTKFVGSVMSSLIGLAVVGSSSFAAMLLWQRKRARMVNIVPLCQGGGHQNVVQSGVWSGANMIPASMALSPLDDESEPSLCWFVKTETFKPLLEFKEIKPHLEAHKQWVNNSRKAGVSVTSGYRVDADGRPGGGGLMLFRAEDQSAAERFVLEDPLVANDCVDWQVNQWIAEVGDIKLIDGGKWHEKISQDEPGTNPSIESRQSSYEPSEWASEPATRIGHGFDIHRMVDPTGSGTPVVIGGVSFDNYEKEIVAHSDGDVVYHSIVDAIFGAFSLPDIGQAFPDTDARWKGAPSHVFMSEAHKVMDARGYRIGNLDVTLIAQAPRMMDKKHPLAEPGKPYDHKADMVVNIASLLQCPPSRINVKARTHENVDAVGEERALSCHVVALLEHAESLREKEHVLLSEKELLA